MISSLKLNLVTLLLSLVTLSVLADDPSDDYTNLCGACVGNGYSYCPDNGVCFDPNVIVTPAGYYNIT